MFLRMKPPKAKQHIRALVYSRSRDFLVRSYPNCTRPVLRQGDGFARNFASASKMQSVPKILSAKACCTSLQKLSSAADERRGLISYPNAGPYAKKEKGGLVAKKTSGNEIHDTIHSLCQTPAMTNILRMNNGSP